MGRRVIHQSRRVEAVRHASRVLTTVALAWAAAGCGNELELSAAGDQVAARERVSVRTRPVCGDSVVGDGEECDDGNSVDSDGCDARCQTPCAAGELAIVGCRPGRTFIDRFEVYSQTRATWVAAQTEIQTVLCDAREADAVEVAVCTGSSCLNVLPPSSGGRVCAAPCERTTECAEGFACIGGWADQPAVANESYRHPEGPQRVPGRCLPAVGAGVGARCSGGGCGVGLTCNTTAGVRDLQFCMPGDCDDDDDCPEGALCLDAINLITGDPSGKACFNTLGLAPGTRVDLAESNVCLPHSVLPVEFTDARCAAGCDQLYDVCELCFVDARMECITKSACRRNCLAGANTLFLACLVETGCRGRDRCATREAGSDWYCAPRCGPGQACPRGWTCQDFGEGGERCVAPDDAALSREPPRELTLERAFPPADCLDDVDTTCTFESACDADCAQSTGCGTVPTAGLCREGRTLFCQSHRVVSIDCGARDLVCGYDAELSRFDCIGGGG